MMRLSQVSRKLNIGKNTIIEFLSSHGYEVKDNPNFKIEDEALELLAKEFADSALDKEEASFLSIGVKHSGNVIIDTKDESAAEAAEEEDLFINTSQIEEVQEDKTTAPPSTTAEKETEPTPESEPAKLTGLKVVGKIDLEKPSDTKKEDKKGVEDKTVTKEEKGDASPPAEEQSLTEEVAGKETKKEEFTSATEEDVIKGKAETLKGLNVLGKIELKEESEKPVASSDESKDRKKKKRKRKRVIKGEKATTEKQGGARTLAGRKHRPQKEEPTEKEIQEQIKATLARLSGGDKQKTSRGKYRREKRSAIAEAHEKELQKELEDSKILKVSEFISTADIASMMDVSVNDIISAFMNLGMVVSINQRLDAESITLITEEFGYTVEFIEQKENIDVPEEEDLEEDLEERPPIVTIMGHVDHGKTSLLDFIRESKVTAGEAGGITQHIGAYDVTTKEGKRIAFLDTPGHEAFTAMRARGAKLTDIAVIVVAADDHVMPQTKEAINHALVADVPIIIAINKIDKPNANPDKIKEELANINILVEDWGGKYQSQEISAKTGEGVDELLEKILLEAEILELKANKNKNAIGSVVEAELDKGRGYVATVLVQTGTLHVGDIIVAGSHYGRVKAMFDHRGRKVKEAGPSTPVLVLGLNGAPQAGDKLNVMSTEREAREIANKRAQLLREQGLRTKKHITLDEIGRRLAIGSFKELNVILKGDVDGSIEALSDALLKLSTEEIQINIIHKAVGQISESDVLLASATDAVIIGFQVRPSANARRLAEKEEIEIRLYSVIYDAINEVKDAMEGMLVPEYTEEITANVEVREVFKISKVGAVAGCMVTQGTIKRNSDIRLIRDGIVIYSGEIEALKRFKEDASEVKQGYECGIKIKNFNDIKVGDVIEAYEQKELKRTL